MLHLCSFVHHNMAEAHHEAYEADGGVSDDVLELQWVIGMHTHPVHSSYLVARSASPTQQPAAHFFFFFLFFYTSHHALHFYLRCLTFLQPPTLVNPARPQGDLGAVAAWFRCRCKSARPESTRHVYVTRAHMDWHSKYPFKSNSIFSCPEAPTHAYLMMQWMFQDESDRLNRLVMIDNTLFHAEDHTIVCSKDLV